MINIFRTLCLIVGVALLAMGQGPSGSSTVRAGFSPVPIWSSTGIPPDLGKQQYVFYDPNTNEIVLSFPEDATIENGPRSVMRFSLHNGVNPMVSLTISTTSNGGYVYKYAVHNGQPAKQSLREMSFFIPAAAQLAGSHPLWRASQIATNESSRLPVPNASQLTELTWTAPAAQPLMPGGVLGGFQLTANALPGFITVLGRGAVANEYSTSMEAQLPDAVKTQLKQVLTPAWDGNTSITIGPKFQPGTPQIIIAADFYTGIRILVHHKLLDANSPFVTSTLTALQTFINSQQQMFDISQLDLSRAHSGLEQQVATALSISLSR